MGFITLVFGACVLLVPLLMLLVLLLLWALPLRLGAAKGLLYAFHALDAWSSLEVFLTATLVG